MEATADGVAATNVVVSDENYKLGTLRFVRYDYKSLSTLDQLAREKKDGNGGQTKNNPFFGVGQTIKGRSNK